MGHNAILAINGATVGFNWRGYVIRAGVIYRDTRLDCDPLVIQKNGEVLNNPSDIIERYQIYYIL